ncbi:MAG: hypothetical protein P4L71_08725 [Acetobacteraceae bacterium]|nr:hypothetical protein [Acetobacteraceae bacterium]
MTLDDLTKIIPAATALVAVIVGPILQWKIARRQSVDNISAKRQNWIDELRKDCAAFLQLSAKLEELRRPNPQSSLEDQKRTFEERAETNSKAHELFIRIRLRLNPNESDHIKLYELFGGLAAICKDPPPEETEDDRKESAAAFHEQNNKIVSHLQAILKKEWERVKKGG